MSVKRKEMLFSYWLVKICCVSLIIEMVLLLTPINLGLLCMQTEISKPNS